MIISDMNYQEYADESNTLVGGLNIGGSITTWDSSLVQFATMSASGPGGSAAGSTATTLDISSLGVGLVILGL